MTIRQLRIGALAALALGLMLPLWIGWAGVPAAAEAGHCRDEITGAAFTYASHPAAGRVDVEDAGNGRCGLPGVEGPAAGWEASQKPLRDGGAATAAGWRLADTYEWVDGYGLAATVANQYVGALTPIMTVLTLGAMAGLVVSEWRR